MSMKVNVNIISCTKAFMLNPVFQNQKVKSLFDFFTRTVGYHGTSEGQIGDQLKEGKFENANRPIYLVPDKETATAYALRASRKDGTKPLVLEISSTTKTVSNEGDKGVYRYFPPGPTQDVSIDKAYEVKDHT